MTGLWRGKPATVAQARFAFHRKSPKKPTQADVLAAMLRRARAAGAALTLPEIMQAGIAQFTARIFELRESGFVIENQLDRGADGRVHSRYWLRFDPEQDGSSK